MTTAIEKYPASDESQIGQKGSGANESTDLVNHLLKSGSLTDKQIEYARRVQSKLEASRPLLQVIKELEFITDEQIKAAIRKNPVSMSIGGLLVEMGHIEASDLRLALAIQKEEKSKRKIGEILVDNQLIEEQVLVETLSLQHGLPFITPEWSTIDRKLFTKVPLKWYEKHHLLPIRADGVKIIVAFDDPLNQEDHQAARQVFGDSIIPVVACKSAIKEVVLKAQRREMKKQVSTMDEQFIVKLVDDIMLAAIQRDASDIHIEPFMIASTVVSIISQRHLRKVCPSCNAPYKGASPELQRVGYTLNDINGTQLRKGRGCTNCQHTGYKGRVGIFELLIIDELVRDAILERRTSKALRQISIESTGLITLLEDGIVKAADGATTLDEVLRSLPRLQNPRPVSELRRLIGDSL